ncbi:patatin-like phospholipase family protein [Maribacter sp. MMG018]|uniref:patatin-like phospholipase family protein n=1 Tax=Maribacter sp. MMG018 TaxID=2822688 RepID=UPI001B367FAD|nr:patatin-like phospholipase family protein [Maribacter sp. MMG018]MBQ4914567.1 patatin-like phospholipase family protein [Maribacter sp. MMG018]
MQKTVFILITLCITSFGIAQKTIKADDIKVGLVLSGGGAKGLAHIGALKVIDDLGIQIDYIGGTSMGAIVGALYAAGYSATELDSIFRATDFTTLIQDHIPRNAKTFYKKENSERYVLTLPFDKFKISTPAAYSGGHNIYSELVRLLYHVRDTKKFSQLPIPFLCIATNVETGEEIVLENGYLPEAVMASGTLPSLFESAEIDGNILIDGGVVNNYPLEEVKKMGADIIIGVDVQHGLSDRSELTSAMEILNQINNFRTVNYMKEKSKKTNIYIKPNMEEFSVLDFARGDTIISLGEAAANKKYNELKLLPKSKNNSNRLIKGLRPNDEINIVQLSITGNNKNYSRGYIKGKLRFELGESITFAQLQQGMSNLAATGNFNSIRYRLVSNDVGDNLILKLEENQNKTFIRLSAHYDDLYKSGALANLTHKNFLMKDDVASFDFIVGDRLRYKLQYYVDKGSYLSYGFNSSFNDFEKTIGFDVIQSNYEGAEIDDVQNINLGVTDFTNQLYFQTVWREEFAFTLGLEHNFLKFSTPTLSKILNENTEGQTQFQVDSDNRVLFEKSNYYSIFGNLTFDTFDDKYFPVKGLYFNSNAHFYLHSSDFNNNFSEFAVVKAKLGLATPLTKNLSVNIQFDSGLKLGTSDVTSFDFVLGGYGADLINNFVPFLGYDFLSIPGNSYIRSKGTIDYEFTPKNHLLFSVDYANVGDDLFQTGDWFTKPSFTGYGIGYGLESFLGPIKIMYSWSPEVNEGELFFSIGYWF